MPLSKLACADILCQVAAGMDYLSQQDFIHTTLAAQHILIGDNYRIRITDLHLGGFAGSQYLLERREHPFCLRKSAPELLLAGEVTTKSDVWSFAALTHEVFTQGEALLSGFTDRNVLLAFANGISASLPSPPRSIPHFLISAHRRCLMEDADERPSFQFLHKLFTQFVLEVYRNSMG